MSPGSLLLTLVPLPSRRLRVLLSAIAVLVTACGGGDNGPGAIGAGGGPAPLDWVEPLVGGGQFDAGDHRGQDLVLWFWAPW